MKSILLCFLHKYFVVTECYKSRKYLIFFKATSFSLKSYIEKKVTEKYKRFNMLKGKKINKSNMIFILVYFEKV